MKLHHVHKQNIQRCLPQSFYRWPTRHDVKFTVHVCYSCIVEYGTCLQHAIEQSQATATERGGHSVHVDDIRLYLTLHDMAIVSERNTLQLTLISVQFM